MALPSFADLQKSVDAIRTMQEQIELLDRLVEKLDSRVGIIEKKLAGTAQPQTRGDG